MTTVAVHRSVNWDELRSVFGTEPGALDASAVARVAPKRGATLVITNGAESVICASGDPSAASR